MNATCGKMSGELYAAVRGELPAPQASEVEAHLAACEDCRAERDGMRDLQSLFARMPGPEPSPGGFARVRAAIETEDARRRNRLRYLLPPLVAAAAAFLAILLAPSSPPPSRLTPLHGAIRVGSSVPAVGKTVALNPGDTITSAGACRLRLTGGRGMELVLGEGTRTTWLDRNAIEVVEGRVFATVEPGEDPVFFFTPVGRAIVTGTRFTLTVDGNGTDLAVLSGEVTFRTGAAAPVRVVPGHAVTVAAEGRPGVPRKVDPWRVRDWFSRPSARLADTGDALLLSLSNPTPLPMTLKAYDPGSAAYSLMVRDPDGRLGPREVRLQAAMIRDGGRTPGNPDTVTLAPGESYTLAIAPDRALPEGRFLVSAVYKPYGELPAAAWRGVLATDPVEIVVGD